MTVRFRLEFFLLPFVIIALLFTIQGHNLNSSRLGWDRATSTLLPRFQDFRIRSTGVVKDTPVFVGITTSTLTVRVAHIAHLPFFKIGHTLWVGEGEGVLAASEWDSWNISSVRKFQRISMWRTKKGSTGGFSETRLATLGMGLTLMFSNCF
jgi:hypothetical protein